jgi:hypothetical protein
MTRRSALLHLERQYPPLACALDVGGRVPEGRGCLWFSGAGKAQVGSSENQSDVPLDEHGSFPDVLTDHVHTEYALDQVLLPRGDSSGRIPDYDC